MTTEKTHRKILHAQQGGLCIYCERVTVLHCGNVRVAGNFATIDHAVPLARGGPNSFANKILACFTCNNVKGLLTRAEFVELREQFGSNLSGLKKAAKAANKKIAATLEPKPLKGLRPGPAHVRVHTDHGPRPTFAELFRPFLE